VQYIPCARYKFDLYCIVYTSTDSNGTPEGQYIYDQG